MIREIAAFLKELSINAQSRNGEENVRMKTKNFQRILAFILVLCMVLPRHWQTERGKNCENCQGDGPVSDGTDRRISQAMSARRFCRALGVYSVL